MKKKIVFGITGLTVGGAERVLVDLANRLSSDYDITIFTIYAKGEFEKDLSDKVKIISIQDKPYSELTNFQKHFVMPIKVLLNKGMVYKKYIKNKFNVEIAFLEGPVTRIFSTKNKNARKIAWIHNDMGLVFGKGIKAKIKKKIDKKIYSRFDKIVFVSLDNRIKFDLLYKDGIRNSELEKIKEKVIHNYVNSEMIFEKSEKEQEVQFNNKEINFVTVCRLVEQKALDRLINVHTKLIKNNINYNMYVIGDGPLKKELLEKVKENRIEKSFKLLGQKENPYPYIKNADVFCLLSYFEGYPMVVEEAKILGKKILITNTAAREVVRKYDYAEILENNEDAIYEGIKKQITKIKTIPQVNESVKKYDNEEIIKKVKELIEE